MLVVVVVVVVEVVVVAVTVIQFLLVEGSKLVVVVVSVILVLLDMLSEVKIDILVGLFIHTYLYFSTTARLHGLRLLQHSNLAQGNFHHSSLSSCIHSFMCPFFVLRKRPSCNRSMPRETNPTPTPFCLRPWGDSKTPCRFLIISAPLKLLQPLLQLSNFKMIARFLTDATFFTKVSKPFHHHKFLKDVTSVCANTITTSTTSTTTSTTTITTTSTTIHYNRHHYFYSQLLPPHITTHSKGY